MNGGKAGTRLKSMETVHRAQRRYSRRERFIEPDKGRILSEICLVVNSPIETSWYNESACSCIEHKLSIFRIGEKWFDKVYPTILAYERRRRNFLTVSLLSVNYVYLFLRKINWLKDDLNFFSSFFLTKFWRVEIHTKTIHRYIYIYICAARSWGTKSSGLVERKKAKQTKGRGKKMENGEKIEEEIQEWLLSFRVA